MASVEDTLAWIEAEVRRLRQEGDRPRESGGSEPPAMNMRTIDYTGDPLKGLFKYLNDTYPDRQYVTMSASSVHEDKPDRWGPHHLLDFVSNSTFHSQNTPGQWIKATLSPTMRIVPTAYAIRSADFVNWCHPKAWALEGSSDDVKWVILDKQENNDDFGGEGYTTKVYLIEVREECRYLRLTQIRRNAKNTHYFGLTAFEVFGTLRRIE
jgi:hypothetical protein